MKAVISSESQDSIHRTQLQERRQKRQEAADKEKAETDRKIQENVDKIDHQKRLQELEKVSIDNLIG